MTGTPPLNRGRVYAMSVATLLAKKQGNTITIHAHTLIAEAVSILSDHKIGALVVVDDGNKVIGILSE
ncbi:MAG TPA: inosine-5-monophosphate dehydrogenase, partial [Rhodospirillaceae bacterium]|nr:inosine-5-monophosphate dehydrogenase [Rhodospirillaceae bacterium]